MRAIVLSADAFSTSISSTPSTLMDPAKTGSPGPLARGMDSPVTGDSSRLESPARIRPSAATRSPGRTSTRSRGRKSDTGTVCCFPCASSRTATVGIKAVSARIPARARSAATLSSNSPTENKKTTAAASSPSPMNSAPSAATDISISMEKGEPERARTSALRANGKTPSSTATVNKTEPCAGNRHANQYAAPISTPRPMTSWPFFMRHQGRRGALDSASA